MSQHYRTKATYLALVLRRRALRKIPTLLDGEARFACRVRVVRSTPLSHRRGGLVQNIDLHADGDVVGVLDARERCSSGGHGWLDNHVDLSVVVLRRVEHIRSVVGWNQEERGEACASRRVGHGALKSNHEHTKPAKGEKMTNHDVHSAGDPHGLHIAGVDRLVVAVDNHLHCAGLDLRSSHYVRIVLLARNDKARRGAAVNADTVVVAVHDNFCVVVVVMVAVTVVVPVMFVVVRLGHRDRSTAAQDARAENAVADANTVVVAVDDDLGVFVAVVVVTMTVVVIAVATPGEGGACLGAKYQTQRRRSGASMRSS